MSYFPQPKRGQRAHRLRLEGAIGVSIRLGGSQSIRATLRELSVTGGLLLLPKAFKRGDFVELAFSTGKGTVHGMAELLAARSKSISGCLQPFRFIALADEDHTRLRMVMELLSD
jgi:hypothetical protein